MGKNNNIIFAAANDIIEANEKMRIYIEELEAQLYEQDKEVPKFVLPCKNYIEMTGSTGPEYNGWNVPSYEKAVGYPHSGCDIVPTDYTSIGEGKVIKVDKYSVGGLIVVELPYNATHKIIQIMYHGKPLKKVGDIVTSNDYITDSSKPHWDSMKGMGAHTHFELRLFPINQELKSGWWDYKRMEQSFDPLTLCEKRSANVGIGPKMKDYIENWMK